MLSEQTLPLAVVAGLHLIDGLVVVLYLIGITIMGVWMGRRLRGLDDFFMPRKFGKGMMMMHAFGTGTASDQAVTVSSATFRTGLSGIWYQWLWLFVTPFYWLIAPIFRRFRAITTADVYELRYDRSVAVLFAIVGIASMCIKIGLMLKGAGALVDAGTGGLIDASVAIIAVTLMFVIYGAAGGLGAAIVTDYIQGILTIAFSFMLLPFILSEVGGISGVRETISNDAMLSLVAPGKISWFFVIMMSFQALVGIVAQPFIMGV
ncbi:MAG: sodium:solute symporter family protein, partial [bacterium]|nr:sodium:solute symporter family protein [bacterium]